MSAPLPNEMADPLVTATMRMPRLSVLCVDDEPQVVEGLCRILRRHYRVLTATSGAAGLDILEREKDIAVIVSDMRMPQMDGATFLRRARTLAPEAIRILLTGQSDPASAVAAINEGQIFHFLSKPCPAPELLAAIGNAVSQHRQIAIGRLLLEQNLRAGQPAFDLQRALGELLDHACRLFDSSWAALGLHTRRGSPPRHVVTAGIAPAPVSAENLSLAHPLVSQLLVASSPLRHDPKAATAAGDESCGHFLGTPVATASQWYGWMFFADHSRASPFSVDDERIIGTLASGIAALCEMGSLHDLSRQHAAEMEQQQVTRLQAEARAGELNRETDILAAIHQAGAAASSRSGLLSAACAILTGLGGFRSAWAGVLQNRELRPVSGDGHPVLTLVDNGTTPASVIDSALASGRIRTRTNVAADPVLSVIIGGGATSATVMPLLPESEAVALLCLGDADCSPPTDQEIRFLNRLRAELSAALTHLTREEQVEILYWYDSLTRLPNRRLLMQKIKESLQQAQRSNETLALVCIDLEHFKALNDSIGAYGGDEVLTLTAARLVAAAGTQGLVARLGDDRFAVLLPNLAAGAADAEHLRQRLLVSLAAAAMVGGREIRIGAKLGAAVFPQDADDAESLLRNAETALKIAKSKNLPAVLYTQGLGAAASHRLGLEERLRRALELNQFRLHHQPKIDLHNGQICGSEALLRWESPELGLVPPMQFIALLEETGLILEVGRWALHQAAADHRAWRNAGLPAPPVAVNVSALQLRQPDFVDVVASALAAGAPGVSISLEITESMLLGDVESTIGTLKAIRELGVDIAIDDFGTGYSSLSYLGRLPITEIKIDRSFVVRMTDNADTMAVVSSIISLSRALNLGVVAEGVDSPEQLRFLRLLRCDEMQGFLFSEPLPAVQYAELLRQGRRLCFK